VRLIWLSIVGLVCIATAFLLRGSISAHAEKYAGPIEWPRSNVENKGDRLSLNDVPPLGLRTVSIPVHLARPAQTMRSELSEVSGTVWHWRQGAKTITKVLSNGETTQIARARLARRE
jgi:hypothetical protein